MKYIENENKTYRSESFDLQKDEQKGKSSVLMKDKCALQLIKT